MRSIYHDLPVGSLNSFHDDREKRYKHTYLCKECHRGFDSLEKKEKCKFCAGKIVEMRAIEKVGPEKKTMYRHYCATCEKNFLAEEKMAVCINCRTDYLHVYTWEMLSRRDRAYINIRKALQSVFVKKQKTANVKDAPAGDVIVARPRFTFFRRSQEEMPTY